MQDMRLCKNSIRPCREMQGESEESMYTFDMEFDLYNDEPPIYFIRPANEFDGYDPVEMEGQKEQAAG